MADKDEEKTEKAEEGKEAAGEEIVAEDLDDSVVAEEHAAESVKKLREKLKHCEAEKQEYLTGWQRAKADLINARKRDEEDRRSFALFANERLMDDVIPVLESYDIATGNKETWEKADKNWRTGVEYIFMELKKALANNGLAEINPLGERFDSSRDEAVTYEPVADEKDHHRVLAVTQKGYRLNGKVLQPAKVKVGEYKKP